MILTAGERTQPGFWEGTATGCPSMASENESSDERERGFPAGELRRRCSGTGSCGAEIGGQGGLAAESQRWEQRRG